MIGILGYILKAFVENPIEFILVVFFILVAIASIIINIGDNKDKWIVWKKKEPK